MQNPIVKRLVSLLIFAMGVALAVWLKKAHDTGGSIEDRAIIFMPVLLLTGFMGMVNPGLMLSGREMRTAPMGKRLFVIGVAVIGAGIGLWLRFVVFKEWSVQR